MSLTEKRPIEKVLQDLFPKLKISVLESVVYYDAYADEKEVQRLVVKLDEINMHTIEHYDLKLERRVF